MQGFGSWYSGSWSGLCKDLQSITLYTLYVCFIICYRYFDKSK